ncbi:LIS1 [Carpediemonas membranifera]|uniref:LIS1 n=1 Tax=Carpediemonas membranifera TaxID=201153 RepID=A0A8J6B013_9EUKA|nr:LIS1 [Carpediemonas membranifera]|eukprot:KAG9391324.1 LIS1 [Carpediemonas membranifera]
MDGLSTVEKFKEQLLGRLKDSGELDQIMANLRRACFQATRPDAPKQPPKTSPETYVMCQLVKEFLESCGMWASSSVFEAEAGLDGYQRLSRDALIADIGLDPATTPSDIPLLYEVLRQARSKHTRSQPSQPSRQSGDRERHERPATDIRLGIPY